jgi:hypothetical protein
MIILSCVIIFNMIIGVYAIQIHGYYTRDYLYTLLQLRNWPTKIVCYLLWPICLFNYTGDDQ